MRSTSLVRQMMLPAGLGVICALTGALQAQIVVPVPERTPDAKPYTPPPPPPERPVQPQREAARPEPLPSVIELDENGDLKPLEPSKHEAALRAFDFDEETWAKLDPVIEAYRDSVHKTVISEYETMVGVVGNLETIEDVSDFGTIVELTQSIRSLPNNDLLDRAKRANAITTVQARRVESVWEAYDKAFKEQLGEKFDNNDAMLITAVFGKHIYKERTKEYMASLQAQLAESAPNASRLLSDAGVQGVAVPRVAGEPLVRWWTELLTERLEPAQAQAVLKAARPDLFQD